MDKLTLLLALATSMSSLTFVSGQNSEDAGLSDARDHLGTISNFIADKKGRLAIRNQKVDMFGLPQDPKKAKAIQQQKKVEVAKIEPTIPLQKVLDALPITMIDPMGDRVVMKGAPPIRKGETLELAFGGQTIMLRFEGARSTGAYFREMKTKKLGLRKMKRLPAGIKRGIEPERPIAGGIHQVDENKPQTIKMDLNQGFQSD